MDGVTLAFDAAAGDGSIALLRDGRLVAEQSVVMRSADEERFLPAVLELLNASGVALQDVSSIVCGEGPGSFTALRVVAAAAKGLAVGLDRPLLAVPSLALIVAASDATRDAGVWLATLDALRGDRYLARVRVGASGAITEVESLGLAPATEVATRATQLGARCVGPQEALIALPHARGVERCAALVLARGAVDVESWEPRYGRLAEAQVKWEAAAGRPLRAAPSEP